MNIVEKMARAICCGNYSCEFKVEASTFTICQMASYMKDARAALTATGLTEAQLEGLASGEMVCVPVEPTEAMTRAGWAVEELVTPDKTWRAMLAAREG